MLFYTHKIFLAIFLLVCYNEKNKGKRQVKCYGTDELS